MGYITKGKGVTVHRKDCHNVVGLQKRLIDVYWNENLKESIYPVDLKITAEDRNNLLADIVGIFNQKKTPVTAINAFRHPNTLTSTINVTIYVKNADVLRDVMNAVQNVTSVITIERISH